MWWTAWRPAKASYPTENKSIFPSPIISEPYTDSASAEYLSGSERVNQCYLDAANTTRPPSIFAYPGIPQHQPDPLIGSYEELGLAEERCFDRYGRLGPYGFGYEAGKGGLGIGLNVERDGSQVIWDKMGGPVDWRGMDWKDAQDRCHARNQHRFRTAHSNATDQQGTPNIVSRTAVVLRAYTGLVYSPYITMYLRALINELAIASGGEYTVHLLLHVRNNSLIFWESEELRNEILEQSVPAEFRGLATLWSEKQMEKFIYPGLDEEKEPNKSGRPFYSVFRSAYMPLQHFALQHPEYTYFWNWEMDIRYTSHYYTLFNALSTWSKRQSRLRLWERSASFYLPSYHRSWANFTRSVALSANKSSDPAMMGPTGFPTTTTMTQTPSLDIPSPPSDDPDWGINEEADLITTTPIFNPSNTDWEFANDYTGYPPNSPPPPRRAALMLASRLSRQLLLAMHAENRDRGRTMFSEMFPASVALQQGLKAVSAPHPVFMDRAWDAGVLAGVMNGESSASLFKGGKQGGLAGGTWWWDARFGGGLWRRWLGFREDGSGRGEEGNGTRMCLRGMLVHPVKWEERY